MKKKKKKEASWIVYSRCDAFLPFLLATDAEFLPCRVPQSDRDALLGQTCETRSAGDMQFKRGEERRGKEIILFTDK